MNSLVLSLNLLLYLVEACPGKVARILRVPMRRSIWMHQLERGALLHPLRLLHLDTTSANLVARYGGERRGQFFYFPFRTLKTICFGLFFISMKESVLIAKSFGLTSVYLCAKAYICIHMAVVQWLCMDMGPTLSR